MVSGGHTHLFEVQEGFSYRLLGKTRDDAAGEAFDKVGKLLGYGYPGGPVIDRLAPYGDSRAVRFTFARMKGNALDFSFSGLKTAVLRWVESRGMAAEIAVRRALLREHPQPAVEQWLAGTPQAGRSGLQLGPAVGGPVGGAAVPGVLSIAGALHRQRRNDRRRRFSQAGARRIRRSGRRRASQSGPGLSLTLTYFAGARDRSLSLLILRTMPALRSATSLTLYSAAVPSTSAISDGVSL